MSLKYKIPSYQSIFDALTKIEVPLDSIVSVLNTSDLDLDSDLTGEDLIYEETKISKPKGGQVANFTAPTTSSYVTNSSQNLFDVTLMTVGDLNKIVLLVSSNFNNINDYPDGVKTVTYNNSDITDSGFKLALKKSNINITTGIVEESAYDMDALAFINASGISDDTQKNAINHLVLDLKADLLWVKFYAIYPMVGGTELTHKWNLKDVRDLDTAYRLVFNGGWTHSGTGALPNEVNAYADTFLIPNDILTIDDTHTSFYSRTDSASGGMDIGAYDGTGSMLMYLQTGGNLAADSYDTNDRLSVANANTEGFYINNKSGTTHTIYKDGVDVVNGIADGVLPTTKIEVGGLSAFGQYSNREFAFVSIGKKFTAAEALTFNNIVQTFQTSLLRQI